MASGYRGGARPDVYDPSHRVRPCDGCGAGFIASEAERMHTCDVCRHEQEVPEARSLSVPQSPSGDERERLAHLATQLEHQWLTPKSVVRFGGNVLEEEIGEARVVWAGIRRRMEDDPDDENAALELLCVTFALHGALPAGTREERMARRALAESSAEAQRDPHLRQKTLYNLVIGAIRSGEHDHARIWIRQLDARSRSLDADSSYRILSAALATAVGDHSGVLKLLGRDASEVPIHASSRGLAAVLRATALEKLGSLDAAVEVLYAEVLRRHGALALISELVASFPKEWALCERSLPLAIERDRDRLVNNIPARTGVLGPLVLVALFLLSASVWGTTGWRAMAAGAVAIMLIAGASVYAIRDTRRRRDIVRGSIPVRGRIRAVRITGPGPCELDVTVEREDLPDEQVTTLQTLAVNIQKMELEGCSFDALWNPAHPTLFPRITISVSGADVATKPKQTG